MTEKLLQILKKELISLEKSAQLLRESQEKCQKIGLKKLYNNVELEQFEVVTARFSRLSDFLIQKIFRLIDALELVDEGTILDRLNRAEKRDLVSSAKQFTELRHVRNTIAHEYEPDEYTRIFKDVLELTPYLLDSVAKAQNYCKKF
jgi:hypothetical protein